jgi:uncharacterized protein YbjT (DUF2867 family)
METVAVAGATGNAGREIVRALSAKGVRIRALVRTSDRLGSVRQLCEQVRVVQVTDKDSVRGSLDGVGSLISAIGKTRQKDATPRRAVDVDANCNLFAEAARAGLKRIGFISVAGAAHDHPAVMMRMKADAEDALKSIGLPYLIVRPGGYFSDLWDAFELCRRGIFLCIGDGQVRFNPISTRDLGQFVAEHFLGSANGSLTLSVGGPQILRMSDLAEISGEILERKVKVIHVPIRAVRALVALIKPFSRNSWEIAQFFVESTYDASRGRQNLVLPPYGQVTLEDYLRRRYEAEKLAAAARGASG